MGLGGSFLDPPGPLEDPLEGALEENLEAPGFPPRRPPACLFFDLAFILTTMVQWLYGYIAVGSSNRGSHIFFLTFFFLQVPPGGWRKKPGGSRFCEQLTH